VKKVVAILLLTITAFAGASAQKGKMAPAPGSDKQVHFYPNPATAVINFEFRNKVESGSVLQVYSFLGRKMANINVVSSRMTVSLNEYVTGIYIFQLRDPAGRVLETNKFQVAH
jgi:hypothetical protein